MALIGLEILSLIFAVSCKNQWQMMAVHGGRFDTSHPHQKYNYHHGHQEVNLGLENWICDTGGKWILMMDPSLMSTFTRFGIIRYTDCLQRETEFHRQ